MHVFTAMHIDILDLHTYSILKLLSVQSDASSATFIVKWLLGVLGR